MNRAPFVAFGLAGALALAAPASAQHHRNGGEQRRESAEAPRQEQRQERQAQPQQQAQPRQERREAQPQQAQPRQENRERAVPREEYNRRNAPQNSGPRYNNAPRYAPRYNNGARYYSGRYYGPRYVGPRFSIAPRRFYRPYYVFRPRFSIGFGIWAGYPVTYYDPYYYPYEAYPYAVSPQGGPGYPPPQGSVNVQPYGSVNQGNMGGLSFDITPDTAEVYVDGNFFGEVNQFTSSSQPLGLPAGRHHVELREPGFEVSSFDVDIIAGQVIPYQGQLQP